MSNKQTKKFGLNSFILRAGRIQYALRIKVLCCAFPMTWIRVKWEGSDYFSSFYNRMSELYCATKWDPIYWWLPLSNMIFHEINMFIFKSKLRFIIHMYTKDGQWYEVLRRSDKFSVIKFRKLVFIHWILHALFSFLNTLLKMLEYLQRKNFL